MKTTVSFCDFTDAFLKMGRENSFSYEGKRALFDYLEQYEQDTGEEIELDIIALCCEYTEYENLEEYNSRYDEVESIEEIEDKTTVIRIDNSSFIIQDY